MVAIPDAPEAIEAVWLDEALAPEFPGVKVRSVRVADHHAGTTGRARLALETSGGTDVPGELFVKLPPRDPGQREMVRATGMGLREARFYAFLADEVPVRVPRAYGSFFGEDGTAYLMLLEDLAATGCHFPDREDPDLLGYTSRLIEALAVLHARYWDDARFAEGGTLSWVQPAMRHEVGATLVKQALDQHADTMPPVFRSLGEIYVEQHDAVCDLWDTGEETLVHGDCHLGNLFADGERPGFLDWACLSRSPGVRDVAYFLANSVPVELRRTHERELVERYLRTLSEHGAPAPDFETTWRRYRLHAAYAWVAATTTFAVGDRWQSLEVARGAAKRTNTAVEDLGTVELLREALGR